MSTAVAAPVEDFRPQKKEVEVLKVLAEKVKGHVKWYSVSKCYGFISRCDDGGDLFVHRSVISSCARRFPSLRNGEEVEFSVVETSQGIEATCVTGPGGQPVKGTWPVYRRQRTTSDPNQKGDSQTPDAEQPVKTARTPRRRSNRRRSAGVNESKPDGNTAEAKSASGGENAGDSPNHAAAPRQRRRPQPRNVRNRSAPTEDDRELVNGTARAEVGQGERRGRRFGRPFSSRGSGGMRYRNNNWNANPGWGGGGGYSGPRFYPMGDRNGGYDQGFRRRNFRGRFPRGSRGRPAGTDQRKPAAEQSPEHNAAVSSNNNVIDDNLVEVAYEADILADQMEEVQIDDVLEPFVDAVDIPADVEA